MRLWNAKTAAIELGSATAGHLDCQAGAFEFANQLPSSRVNGCRIFQRRFRLRQHARQALGIALQKYSNILRILPLITGSTRQRQVRDTMTAAIGFGLDMLDL